MKYAVRLSKTCHLQWHYFRCNILTQKWILGEIVNYKFYICIVTSTNWFLISWFNHRRHWNFYFVVHFFTPFTLSLILSPTSPFPATLVQKVITFKISYLMILQILNIISRPFIWKTLLLEINGLFKVHSLSREK